MFSKRGKAIAIGVSVVALSAQADTAPALNPVVVTASKIAEPQASLTQKISIVYSGDGEQIVSPQRNALELLRYEPGMFINPLSRNDANWGSFGGLGPKYNGLLLDGLPVDAFIDPMGLDPWAFDRVESHRGPASVLYGNYMSMDFAGNQSPLAGVSNFVLKEQIDATATRASLGRGHWNTTTAKAYHQGKDGKLNYFLGGSHESSDYTKYGMPNSWLDITKPPEYRKTKIYGKATYFLDGDDHLLSAFANYATHTGDVGRPNRGFDHKYGILNLAYKNQMNRRLGLQAKIGLRDYDRRWSEDNYPGSLSWNSEGSVRQRIVPADLTFHLLHGDNHVLTFGADAQWVDYQTYSDNGTAKSTGNDVTARSYGVFAQERLTLGNWILRAGGRFNRTEHDYKTISGGAPGLRHQSWDKFLWSAGLRYHLSSTAAIFANAGSSFTPPSAKSVGGTILAADLGIPGKNGQLPNPSLKPESGQALDLGLDVHPGRGMDLSVRLFHNQIKDAIVENIISGNPSQTRSTNAGKASSQGVELAWRHAVNNAFSYFANTTFTHTTVKNPLDLNQDGSDLSFVPDNVTNLGFTFHFSSGTTVSPYVQYVGKYYDSTDRTSRQSFGHYGILSVRIAHQIHRTPGHPQIDLFADLYNLGNRKFEMPWMFRDVGFNGMIGLQAQF